jgi:Short C-terminal domain
VPYKLSEQAEAAIGPTLEHGEEVVAVIRSAFGSAVIATDRRVFVFKRFVGKGRLRSWSVRAVTGVALDPKKNVVRVSIAGEVFKPPPADQPNEVWVIDTPSTRASVDELRAAVTAAQSRLGAGADAVNTPLSRELAGLTMNWTQPSLMRTYESTESGRVLFAAEAELLGMHEYVPSGQSEDGGHVHAGRLLVTGGLSVLAGRSGIRSTGSITATYLRKAAPSMGTSAVDPMEQLRQLRALRDAGVLTEEEFAAKKAEILSRV